MKRTVAAILFFAVGAMAYSAPKIGKPAPEFSLTGHDGDSYSLKKFKGKHVVLEWWNKDCPFVRKHYDSNNMQELQKKYTEDGIIWLTILSSAPGEQGYLEAKGVAKVMQEKKGKPTIVLLDPEGKVGRLYKAKTTPHMFLISPEGNLLYKGAIDSNSSADPDDIKTAKNYVVNAITASLANDPVDPSSTTPYGCSVKY